jgi:hypothetical protein
MKNTLLILIIFLCSCLGCKQKYEKRYPEDTSNSLETPEERVRNKWWVLDSVSMNGIDYTDSVHDKIGNLSMYLGESVYSRPYFKGQAESDLESAFGIIWAFTTSRDQIGIYRDPVTPPFFLPLSLYINFSDTNFTKQAATVLKLSTSEFKICIKSNDNNIVIINKFKRQ